MAVIDIGDKLKKKEKGSFVIKDRSSRSCNHFELALSQKNRFAVCVKCDQIIDPFDALIIFYEHYNKFVEKLDGIKYDIKQKSEELDKIKGKLKYLRQKFNSLNKTN